MKRIAPGILLFLATVLGLKAAGRESRLRVEMTPRFSHTPVVFDSLTNETTRGQTVSVTRLDFLVSRFALRRADGVWLEQDNRFAFICAREGRTAFEFGDAVSGTYDRVRFLIGLEPEINHKNPAGYPANHPLNPEVNRLHWGWAGGYVFLALEGNWLRPDGELGGYSYHLATDRHAMTVELPVQLDISGDSELHIELNVDRIFDGPNAIALEDATSSTHSRTNDSLAVRLHENIETAFSVPGVRSLSAVPPEVRLAEPPGGRVVIAPQATPYRLAVSRFFPRPALPVDNPLTEQGVELGRRLFNDPALSINGRQSCASCHQQQAAFTDAGKPVSLGAKGQPGSRNTMPLFNLAWKKEFFWDGRSASLREQVLQPIQNPVEMHETLTNVRMKLQSMAALNYPALFACAFGTPEIDADRIARALEQFLLTQTSHSSRFDRALAGQAQFTEEEQRGFELFHTEYDPRREQVGGDCFHCHGGPLFRSQDFANNGLDQAPGDLGRYEATGRDGDKGKFAVPSLRNVAITGPYMHDGRFGTLEQVIRHYCAGVRRSATLDPNLAKHPDGGVPLSEADQRALIAFLKTLTDARFEASGENAGGAP